MNNTNTHNLLNAIKAAEALIAPTPDRDRHLACHHRILRSDGRPTPQFLDGYILKPYGHSMNTTVRREDLLPAYVKKAPMEKVYDKNGNLTAWAIKRKGQQLAVIESANAILALLKGGIGQGYQYYLELHIGDRTVFGYMYGTLKEARDEWNKHLERMPEEIALAALGAR